MITLSTNYLIHYHSITRYCMAWPRHVMQSVAIPAVTHTRASGDYQPSNSQWNIGDSSILSHSIGLAPFKDVRPHAYQN